MYLESTGVGDRFGIQGNEEGRRELKDQDTVLNLNDQKNIKRPNKNREVQRKN